MLYVLSLPKTGNNGNNGDEPGRKEDPGAVITVVDSALPGPMRLGSQSYRTGRREGREEVRRTLDQADDAESGVTEWQRLVATFLEM
jgi:hypothetical protein